MWPGWLTRRPALRFNLPFAVDDVFVGAKLVQAHRAAGVQAIGGDADFGTKAKLKSVGEAGGGVVEDRSGVHGSEKLLCRGSVFGDNAFGVAGAIGVDQLDGSFCVRNDGDGNNQVGVFRGEVFRRWHRPVAARCR